MKAADALLLRTAAARLRGANEFHNELAAWLDECADVKEAPDVNASLKIALTDRAIKVARAYLVGAA